MLFVDQPFGPALSAVRPSSASLTYWWVLRIIARCLRFVPIAFSRHEADFFIFRPAKGSCGSACEPKPHFGEVLETRDHVCKRDSREPSGKRASSHIRTVQTLVYRLEEKDALRKLEKSVMPNSFSRPSSRANTAAAWCGTCWTCLAGHQFAHFQPARGTITLRDLKKLQSVAARSKNDRSRGGILA
jgi:hypothetical protein